MAPAEAADLGLVEKLGITEGSELPAITTVTFDLWQTLLLDNRTLGRARTGVRLDGAQKALLEFGEEYDLEHIREAYRACFQYCRRIREQNRDISFREQVERFIEKIDEGLVARLPIAVIEEIVRAYRDSFFVYPPRPHFDAVRVLAALKREGYRIGLISNTGMTPGTAFRRFLDEHGLLEYFETLTFSDEVKLSKPGAEIFLMTLAELGAEPGEAVHVGDHISNDVVGANLAGMRTVWIESSYGRPEGAGEEADPHATVTHLGKAPDAIRGLGSG